MLFHSVQAKICVVPTQTLSDRTHKLSGDHFIYFPEQRRSAAHSIVHNPVFQILVKHITSALLHVPVCIMSLTITNL